MYNIFDLHNDFFTEIKAEKQKDRYLSTQNKYRLKNICSAVWTSNLNPYNAFKTINECKNFCLNHNIMFSIEDLHFLNEYNMDEIINLSPSYVSLTWNQENNLAGGALSNATITKLGEKIIRKYEENNIIIDTAHLNEKSFLKFSSITQNPILCSHTAVYCKCNNPRNLKDYQLKIITESQGLIGICFVSHFLNSEKRATISDIVSHIDYCVCNYGIDRVGIGTDFYGTKNLPIQIKNYKDITKIVNRLQILGYTNEAIEKIFYKNAFDFFNKAK